MNKADIKLPKITIPSHSELDTLIFNAFKVQGFYQFMFTTKKHQDGRRS